MSETNPGPIVLWLSSRYENIELAQAALDHVCRHRGVSSEDGHWIGIALREAVANAIKHGNRQDTEKRVLVSFKGEDGELQIVVGDEGEGFDPDAARRSARSREPAQDVGPRYLLIKTFMDDMSFPGGHGRDDPHDEEEPQGRQTGEGSLR